MNPDEGPGIIEPAIQVLALDWESNPGSFGLCADALSTEQHLPGPTGSFLYPKQGRFIRHLQSMQFFYPNA